MYLEKDPETDACLLKIDELESNSRYLIENQSYQMEVRLGTPEAKTVVILAHRRKMPDGSWRPTSINREEHFGWAVWVLREKGIIPQIPENTAFEIYDRKKEEVLKDSTVYATEIEAYKSLIEDLFYRAEAGEITFDEESEGMKPAIMQLYEIEDWALFDRFDLEVRPVAKDTVESSRLRTFIHYSVN